MIIQKNSEDYFGELDKYFTRIKHQYNKLKDENEEMKFNQKLLESFDSIALPKKPNKYQFIKKSNLYRDNDHMKTIFNLNNYKKITDDDLEFNLLKQFLKGVEKNNFHKTNKKIKFNSLKYCKNVNSTTNQETCYMPKITNTRKKTTKISFNSQEKHNFPRKEKSDMGIGRSNIFKTLKRVHNSNSNDTLVLCNTNDSKREYSKKNFCEIMKRINEEELNTTLSKKKLLEKIKKFNKKYNESENKNLPKEINGKDYIIIDGEKIKANKKTKDNSSVDYSKIKTTTDIEKDILNIDTTKEIMDKLKISFRKKRKLKINLKKFPKINENTSKLKFVLPVCPTSQNLQNYV